MTEITLYKCDICGKTFKDEAECQKHEVLEKYGHGVYSWGWAQDDEVKIQFPWTSYDYEVFDLLRFDTYTDYETAKEYVDKVLGYVLPDLDKKSFEGGKPVILWCPDMDDRWIDVREEIKKYQRVMNIGMRKG